MNGYSSADFLRLLFELNSLLRGDYDTENVASDELRAALHQTLTAICAVWQIPPPRKLFRFSRPFRPIDVLIEARHALEIPLSRQRSFMVGKSRASEVTQSVVSVLSICTSQIEMMIAEELGICDKFASDEEVLRFGGYRRSALESVFVESF